MADVLTLSTRFASVAQEAGDPEDYTNGVPWVNLTNLIDDEPQYGAATISGLDPGQQARDIYASNLVDKLPDGAIVRGFQASFNGKSNDELGGVILYVMCHHPNGTDPWGTQRGPILLPVGEPGVWPDPILVGAQDDLWGVDEDTPLPTAEQFNHTGFGLHFIGPENTYGEFSLMLYMNNLLMRFWYELPNNGNGGHLPLGLVPVASPLVLNRQAIPTPLVRS